MPWLGDVERGFAAWIYPNRVLVAIVVGFAVIGVAVLARRRRWDLVARRHPRAAIGLAALALAIGVPLVWYLGSPLFLSRSIDEPPPVVAAAPSADPVPTAAASPVDEPEAPTAGASASTPPTPPVLVERSGTFSGADDFHFGEGTARLIETAPGSFTVRLEDFAVRNGPDLFVYLSPIEDGYADGAIELGRLKADRGNQNYDVPAGADLGRVRSVVIWCKQFAVDFAAAPLT
jgi:hypothetical protein